MALHVIRRIRNEFAHNPKVSFADPKIQTWVDAIEAGVVKERNHKFRFETEAAGLAAMLEVAAVDQAHGRVYEESYSRWYRRGAWNEPFNSKEDAAAARSSGEP